MARGAVTKTLVWPKEVSICRSCLKGVQRRYASAAATALVEPEPPSITSSQHDIPPIASESTEKRFGIKAGILLSRPPLITRDLTPFERHYFLYQRRLNERLVLPFTRYFYYQKDTPADIRWKKKMREREIPARDVGRYNPYTKAGWNDEILMGESDHGPNRTIQALLDDALIEDEVNEEPGSESDATPEEKAEKEKKKLEKEVLEKPRPRVTEADRAGDVRSLNRALSRTLYLLVREGEGAWRFPSGGLQEREDLREAAQRILGQACGVNMNTWLLGHTPVGHFVRNFNTPKADPDSQQSTHGEKTFFMKARIMAGKPDLASNPLSFSDHRWVVKEEIQKIVSPRYWSFVKNMLVEL